MQKHSVRFGSELVETYFIFIMLTELFQLHVDLADPTLSEPVFIP